MKERERYKAIKLIKQVFVRKNSFLSGRVIEKKGRFFRKEKTLFLSDFFCGANFVKENIFNTRLNFYNIWQTRKKVNRNLFVF